MGAWYQDRKLNEKTLSIMHINRMKGINHMKGSFPVSQVGGLEGAGGNAAQGMRSAA